MASGDALDRYLAPRIAPPPPLQPQGLYGTLDPAIAGRIVNSGGTVPGVYNPSAPTGGGTAGSAPPPAPTADIDWADVYFGSYGLPGDLKNQIVQLGQKYGSSNPEVFYQSALNTIRGSDWFKQTYPGFFSGVQAGLFTNETGYRDYVNQLNNVYRQYTGSTVSGAAVESALKEGVSADLVARRFAGDTIANVNRADWQYLSGNLGTGGETTLSNEEAQAAGREQAGIDTPLGQLVQKRLQLASARAQKLFQGTLATPSLTLGAQGVYAPALGRQGSDIAA